MGSRQGTSNSVTATCYNSAARSFDTAIARRRRSSPVRSLGERDMPRRCLSLTALALIAPAAPARAAAPLEEASVSEALKSVVILRTTDGFGSGVAIGDGRVVTAAHVVEGSSRAVVHTSEGRDVRADVVKLDLKRDVALLDAPGLAVAAARLRARVPHVGDVAYAAGAPLGQYT